MKIKDRSSKLDKEKRKYAPARALPYRGNRPSRKKRDKRNADIVKDARK